LGSALYRSGLTELMLARLFPNWQVLAAHSWVRSWRSGASVRLRERQKSRRSWWGQVAKQHPVTSIERLLPDGAVKAKANQGKEAESPEFEIEALEQDSAEDADG
jgi:hypothetical protein